MPLDFAGALGLPRFPDFWLVPPAFVTVVGLFGLQNADGVWVCTGSDWFFGSFLRLLLPWWVILGYKMWVRCMGRDARMAACCDWRCDVVGCSARLVCSCCWGASPFAHVLCFGLVLFGREQMGV